MGIILFARCLRVPLLVSGFPSQGITPCASVYPARLWEEGSSGASYVTVFEDTPYLIFQKGNLSEIYKL